MTADERKDIVRALYGVELRMSERLTRLETLVDGHHQLATRVEHLDKRMTDVDRVAREGRNRLLLGLVLVGVATAGDLVLRLPPLMT